VWCDDPPEDRVISIVAGCLSNHDRTHSLSDMLLSETPCVKLVVSDLHVRLKAEVILILVMFRMNREFMEYMRTSYPDTPPLYLC
jgi:hypothetical protein